uniref:Uncharacterized protein n=1 Tax=Anopheles quadriannulatus TaxID=34691 RepID=A0A182XS09_ANOQN
MKLSYIFFIIAGILLLLNVADATRGHKGHNKNKNRTPSPKTRPSGPPVTKRPKGTTTTAPATAV